MPGRRGNAPDSDPKPGSSFIPNTSKKPKHAKSLFLNQRDQDLHKLRKYKSWEREDVRSPLIPLVSTPYTPYEEDHVSLHTSKTQESVSRIFNLVPETFYRVRNYYNDFTTIDWSDAFIKTNKLQYEIHHKYWIESDTVNDESVRVKIPFYYRAYFMLGRWLLIILIAFAFSIVAYGIDKFEILLVGAKYGYCESNWFLSQVACCAKGIPDDGSSKLVHSSNSTLVRNIFQSGYILRLDTESSCPQWVLWSTYFKHSSYDKYVKVDYIIYVILSVSLAFIACIITLTTRISSKIPLNASREDNKLVSEDTTHSQSIDEDLNSTIEYFSDDEDDKQNNYVEGKSMFTAAGSGVPEVKTILSGFVIRRFLGTYTFFSKTIALVLAIASGMSLGKEGPYVHLAASVGNILSRFFPFVSKNDLIQKQILSAAALSGVALAFGSPLGGVLFILEEINHSLPSFQLFQIFFCAIISTLFLKFLNPYGTGKTVLFELEYVSDWKTIELVFFIIIGLAGGAFGAMFVKFVGWWPKTFRSQKFIKDRPKLEVALIALLTGLITYWNPYTKQATTELILDLASPCTPDELDRSLCPIFGFEYVKELKSLFIALVVKIVLTFVTFGLKLPMGVYVPSMVIGALFGRLFATLLEWLNYSYKLTLIESPLSTIPDVMSLLCKGDEPCIDKGIYAMIGAGAFMAGVTRMNITLVTILFEITSSYTYVLPISISIAVANWMGNLLEPNSLYESLLIANDYPFMSPETEPIDPFKIAGEIVEDSVKYTDTPQTTVPRSPSAAVASRNLLAGRSSSQHRGTVTSIVEQASSSKMYIDLSTSPYVLVSTLRQKMFLLAENAMVDGCIALIKNQICVGLIFFTELELCLDQVKRFCIEHEIDDDVYCKVGHDEDYLMSGVSTDSLREPSKYNSRILQNSTSFQLSEVDYFSYGSTNEANNQNLLQLQADFNSVTDFTKNIRKNPIHLNYDSQLSFAHLVFEKVGNRVIVLIKDGKYYGVLHKKTLVDYIRREEH